MKTVFFENSAELAHELTKRLVDDLVNAIKKENKAFLLVSGGKTPIKLFQSLCKQDIPWEKVTIGLIDERYVSTNNEFSNELLVRTHLLQDFAKKASFIGMIFNSVYEIENIKEVREKYQVFIQNESTISILGMGEDGHTASLFPIDNNSEDDLIGNEKANIITTVSPIPPKRRISCNKNFILASSSIYLILKGESKLDIYRRAETEKLPISYFKHKIQIFYSPT